jgi:hypothetical protein
MLRAVRGVTAHGQRSAASSGKRNMAAATHNWPVPPMTTQVRRDRGITTSCSSSVPGSVCRLRTHSHGSSGGVIT